MDASRLRISSLFEGLSDADVERCAPWFEEIPLTAGSRLVNEGDYSYRFFVVLDGEIALASTTDEGDERPPRVTDAP